MWGLVGDLGFDEGEVLEPGCGSGNFIGLAPPGARLTGVELDATTAAVTRHLYGERATIHTGPFESLGDPDGRYDLVIGNVPFAKVSPYDRRHNQGRHALHNYFLLKSLHLTRPGGLVAALTSRYTLDAHNPAARAEMAELADLVGAVRLPAGAFRESSGTDVVTDLVVLRRREARRRPAGLAWLRTQPLAAGDVEDPPAVNEVFAAHPELVAGHLGVTRGMYRDGELTVEATGALAEDLGACLGAVVAHARRHRMALSPRSEAASLPSRHALPEAPGELEEGGFVVSAEGTIQRARSGRMESYSPRVAKDTWELRRLIALRDAAQATLAVQLTHGSDAELAEAQGVLAERYDDYRRLYGPLNRSTTVRTGRVDPDTGADQLRQQRPRMGGFRDDPSWPLVAALEVFDEETQTAIPAAIFTTRVLDPRPRQRGVDTPAEAVAVSLDEAGAITASRVAELLGTGEAEARESLRGLAWEDPTSGELVPTARYLSGDVRAKLEAAEAAASDDDRWQANVIALAGVLPRQLRAGEITAQLGAPWVPATDVQAFGTEVLGVELDVEQLAMLGQWAVALRSGSRVSVSLTSQWGTARADGVTLLGASLNQRLHTVWDENDDGRRIRNDPETIAAREKQDALGARFSSWVWEEPARAERLAERYNRLFSSTVVPTYDGSHLSLPGLATSFIPHSHQRDTVARILTDGRALLAHAVGAGKTATMVMAAMEMRRLGLASKVGVVVPNHMLEQFSREWLQLYPSAKVLLADRDRLSKSQRKEFVARCALGDWDAVVFSHAGFARLPLSPELRAAYRAEQLDRSRQALAESRAGKAISVKRLERRIAQLEEKHKRLMAEDTKDDGVRFDESGLDYLMVDEAHFYKNRTVDSAIDGMSHAGSQRAEDLDAKLWALRRRHGERVITFATATPVANSMAELWTMQRYLQPDVLDSLDMGPFDAWAANFGRTVTAVELSPDGSSYRLQTRFARFQNVPELLTMYRRVADVRTNEDLDMALPGLVGGKATTVVVPASATLVDYVEDLAQRAEQVRNRGVAPDEDNMLKITGDGRRAALDLRLVGLRPDEAGGKLAVAADRIAAIHRTSRDLRYTDLDGTEAARPGGLQLVFCDVSTPAGNGWNAYDELRELLARRGVPRQEVRFVHEATTDEAKARLFAACRDGRVAVVVGSTEKMGVGTNVQARAMALHHLDCPWRPADIEQREGRLLRQGNQNPEVEVLRYVTEGSFDIYMWQTVERKASFIAQVTTGRLAEREVDDIGDQALSYAEVKALATGNPLIVEKATVDTELARLVRLERSHHDDQHRLGRTVEVAAQRAAAADADAAELRRALAARRETRGDSFAMTVDGTRHLRRTDAGVSLRAVGRGRLEATPPDSDGAEVRVGELAGLGLTLATTTRIDPEISVAVDGTRIRLRFGAAAWLHLDPGGLVQGLERRIENLDQALDAAVERGATARSESDRAHARLGRPFEHAPQLGQLRRRQHEITEALLESSDIGHEGPDASPPPATAAPRSSPPAEELDQVVDPGLAFARSVARRRGLPRPDTPGMGLS
jgi:N12 class adenine-specific DNA methylase